MTTGKTGPPTGSATGGGHVPRTPWPLAVDMWTAAARPASLAHMPTATSPTTNVYVDQVLVDADELETALDFIADLVPAQQRGIVYQEQ